MENVGTATDKEEAPTGGRAITLLSGIGDRELWYAESREKIEEKDGGDGGSKWRFPFFIDWKTESKTGIEYARVYPALCPHYAFSLILKALFEPHNRADCREGWLVRREVIPALLIKAPGINRERYYRWDGREERAIAYTENLTPGGHEPIHLRASHHDRALILQISEACGLQSSIVKLVIDGLNNVAADFMIRQREPMDLGFVKLIAVPFRANWKEIVTFKLRKLGLLQTLKEESGGCESESSQSTPSDTGLPETLCSPHNVALRREKTKKGPLPVSRIDYSLEVITSKKFEKEITSLVTQHRQAGHTAQVGHYEKTVEKLYDSILEILRAYRKKIGLPFARILESRSSGGLRFVETRGHLARAHGRNLRNLPCHIVEARRGFSVQAESSQSELVHPEASQVPKVPAFSQELHDLRERKKLGAVGELLYRKAGDGGVPVLDAGEKFATGESVFLESTSGRESSWVDIVGD